MVPPIISTLRRARGSIQKLVEWQENQWGTNNLLGIVHGSDPIGDASPTF